jgi:hypothetical protein
LSSRRSLSSKVLAQASFVLVLAGGLPALADEERLTLTPAVEVTQSFDSDGQVLQNGERSDSIFEVIPSFRARAERPATGTLVDLKGSLRSRSSTADSDLAAVDETFKAAVRQNLGSSRFVAIANGSFRTREALDPLDRDEQFEIQEGRPDLIEANGDLTLAYSVTARSQISLGYSAFARDFQGPEARENGNRDVDVDALSLAYELAMTPLDRVSLSLSYQKLTFGRINQLLLNGKVARTDTQDDQILSAFASWKRQFSPVWSATLTGGVRRLDSDGGGFRGFESEFGDGSSRETSVGLIGSVSFERETEWNKTRLAYRRETRPSGGIGTSLDVDSFELSFTQQLMRNLSLKLRGDYQISKSASDQFALLPAFPGAFLGLSDPIVCAFGGSIGFLEGVPTCIAQSSGTVDTSFIRLGAELSWRWTRGFVTFLSYDFRDQKVDGIIGGGDRHPSRVRIGFRYAYDYEAF